MPPCSRVGMFVRASLCLTASTGVDWPAVFFFAMFFLWSAAVSAAFPSLECGGLRRFRFLSAKEKKKESGGDRRTPKLQNGGEVVLDLEAIRLETVDRGNLGGRR